MSVSRKISAGGLWLRLAIFVAVTVLLTLALAVPLSTLTTDSLASGNEFSQRALVPVIHLIPEVLGAAAAWLLPRPVSLKVGGPAKAWLWCLALLLLAFLLICVLAARQAQVNSWSDSGGVAQLLADSWDYSLSSFPSALIHSFISITVLWGLCRHLLSAAWAGVAAAAAAAVPPCVMSLIVAFELGTFQGVPTALLGALPALAAWALFYSGVGRLVDGRGPLTRMVFVGAVLAPTLATLLPQVHPVSLPTPDALGLTTFNLALYAYVFCLGALAWALSALASRRRQV